MFSDFFNEGNNKFNFIILKKLRTIKKIVSNYDKTKKRFTFHGKRRLRKIAIEKIIFGIKKPEEVLNAQVAFLFLFFFIYVLYFFIYAFAQERN